MDLGLVPAHFDGRYCRPSMRVKAELSPPHPTPFFYLLATETYATAVPTLAYMAAAQS
jgi:hypothetical protein